MFGHLEDGWGTWVYGSEVICLWTSVRVTLSTMYPKGYGEVSSFYGHVFISVSHT